MRAAPARAAFAATLVTLAAPLSIASMSSTAFADDEPPPAAEGNASIARQRYNLGTQAFAAKRYVEAALYFEAAAAERAHGVALFTAGLAWEQANQPERAADDFARSIATQGLALDKLTQAKEKLSALQSILGRVEITGPEGWRVQLDGFSEAPLPATLHATAGAHTVTVRASDRVVERRVVVLQLGGMIRLDVSTPAEAKPEAAPPATPVVMQPAPVATRPAETRRAVGLVALGVGGATLISGTLLGIASLDAKTAYDEAPSNRTLDHAETLERWTNITLIAGGVFAAAGAALVLWPSPAPRKEAWIVRPSATGVLVGGTF